MAPSGQGKRQGERENQEQATWAALIGICLWLFAAFWSGSEGRTDSST